MQKLRMDLSDLHVESFPVSPGADDGRGTVLARLDTVSDADTCYTNYWSCFNTQECGPLSLQSLGCSDYCEPGPGWSQYCTEEDPG